MTAEESGRSTVVDKGLLAVGFAALVGTVLVAHASPASGYELSLYTNTPLEFWAGLGCAMLLSLVVALRTASRWLRRLALGLGAGAIASFVGLPVLRGYRYYGGGDPLTHLGWIRGIQSGTFAPTELIYPGFHTVATLLAVTFGIGTPHAALLVVVVLSILSVVFVTLSTSAIFESRYATAAGAVSGFLFLPITTVSTFMQPHSMSMAILFSSVTLYLLVKYVLGRTSMLSPSAVGASLAVTSLALVLYHPQLAAHLIAVLLGICGVQFLYRRYKTDHPIAAHRAIYGQTVALSGAFLVWTSNHGFFAGAVEYAVSSAVEYFRGGGAAGKSVASQGTSLVEIGGSMAELFLKMFGADLIFVGLAGLLVLQTIRESDGSLTRATGGTVPYFVVGLCGLGGLFGLYFFGSYSEMYFRVFGLMMLLVAVMGAVAIAVGLEGASKMRGTGGVKAVAAVCLALVLAMSLLAVFPSPYIYLPSPHVTDMSMSGHETAFENQQEDVEFVGIRAGPDRYEDAVRARQEPSDDDGVVNGTQIRNGIPSAYAQDRYLTVSEADRQRELVAYKGLRYTQSELSAISAQPGVNRVQSNGEFELFYVRGTAE